jgi:hypothetical protein
MKRPLSVVLADAFDRAAHDVLVAEQVHAANEANAPTVFDNWSYWWQGFTAGLLGDSHSLPLTDRLANAVHKAWRRLLSVWAGAGKGER